MEHTITIIDDSWILTILSVAAIIALLSWFYNTGKAIIKKYRTENVVYYRGLKFEGKSAKYVFFLVMGSLLLAVICMVVMLFGMVIQCF
jgi:hypothetical protein